MNTKALVKALMDKGIRQEDLARDLGVTQASVSRWLAGSEPRGNTWIALREIGRREQVISDDFEDASPPPADVSSRVKIMGYVGAGAAIEPDFEQVPAEGLGEIELPFSVPDEMIALEIKGDSMLPRYEEGDAVIVWREQKRATEHFLFAEAAVRTSDGRRYLKKIMPGKNSRVFTLESFNAKPITDARLEWIGEIWIIVPAAQVRRANQRDRAAMRRRESARSKQTAGMESLPLGKGKAH